MTKPCSICMSAYRAAIDNCLVNGDSLRTIAATYNVGRSALQRHRADGHINLALIKAAPPAVIAENKTLQDQLKDLHLRTLTLLDSAEASKDIRASLAAIRECRSNLEVLAKIELVLMARASNGDNGGIIVTFDHEDLTPPANSLGVIINPPEDVRNLAHGLPDEDIEIRAVEILKRRGYVVSRPDGVFTYPDDANLSDQLVQELDRITRGYIDQMECGERVDLLGTTVAQRVGYLIALASGARIIMPSDGRNKPESVGVASAIGAVSGLGSVVKQHNFATQQVQTNHANGCLTETPQEIDTTGINREQSLDNADVNLEALENVLQAVNAIAGRMVQADAPVAFVIDHMKAQGVDEATTRRLLGVLVERGIIVTTRPDSYRSVMAKK